MPVTQVLNSKANVKKNTNQDLPFTPQNPVISSYYATSTLSQTVINLSFSVDQTLTDQFFLFVDGKKLRLGASNDYTFTSIGSDNTSQQVTLNAGIAANLNIQAYMLGLKKESEFLMDNRFTQLYAAQSNGFQGFVSSELIINATTTTGTPVAGTFYSAITGRASIIDLSQDLGPRMGIDRFAVQQIFQIQNEFGTNGETVWGAVNDTFNRVRYVGTGWASSVDTSGQRVSTIVTNDFVEITFYGTGLNALISANTSTDFRAKTDGGAEGANLYPTLSAVLNARGYSSNVVIPVVSGLTLGVHTVTLRNNSVNGVTFSGFECLNESGLIKVNPGIGYVQGKQFVSASQSSFAYNADATGTRGGRLVVYQSGDGTIGRAFRAVDATSLFTTSADHTNEEVARKYSPREFGANRTDDFSSLTGPDSTRSFTLDDDSTTMSISSGVLTILTGTLEGVSLAAGTTNFLAITFVGTGLDLQFTQNDGTLRNYGTILLDGVSIGTITAGAVNDPSKTFKIASGLPYGTHTVRLPNAQAGARAVPLCGITVYQPKKPVIPTGVVELADTNILADYSATNVAGNAVADNLDMYAGVLAKSVSREMTFVGAGWTLPALIANNANLPGGFYANTATNTDYVEYTFFGTGIAVHLIDSAAGTSTFTTTIDGVANAGAVNTLSITNNGAGSYTVNTTTGFLPARLAFTGLTAGKHTIRMTKTAGTGNFAPAGMYIITPTHSTKSNLAYDQQNTLPVGSASLGDSRKFSAIKESYLQIKNVAQAVGVTSGPTTTSTSLVPMPDMSVTHTNRTGKVKVTYSVGCFNSGAGAGTSTAIFLNGLQASTLRTAANGTATTSYVAGASEIINVPIGTNKFDIYWSTTSSTSTAQTTQRTITVEEI